MRVIMVALSFLAATAFLLPDRSRAAELGKPGGIINTR